MVFQTVFLLTLILLPVGLAYAQTAPYDPARQYVFGDDSPVTATHPDVQTAPAVSGNIAVWEDFRDDIYSGHPTRIYYKDLSTSNAEQPLVPVPGNNQVIPSQTEPAISGSLVVWLEGQIHYMFLNNGQPGTDQILNVPLLSADWLTVSGHRIIWQDSISGTDQIYMYDLDTGQLSDVSAGIGSGWCQMPAIDGDWVAWVDTTESDVYLKNISSGWWTKVTNDGVQTYKETPSISGNNLIWWKNGGVNDSGGGVFLYDISAGATKVIANDRFDYNAKIDGNIVVWDKWDNTENQIYMCDLSNLGNQSTAVSTKVSNSTSSVDQPSISSGNIVWRDDRLGTWAIFENKLGDTAQTLADRYKPELKMTSDENFEPMPVEPFLAMQAVIPTDTVFGNILEKTALRQVNNPNFNIANPTTATLAQYANTSDLYVDLPGSSVIAGGGDPSISIDHFTVNHWYVTPYQQIKSQFPETVYTRVVSKPGSSASSFIQYWFFYYANDFSESFHEGDWEVVQIDLDGSLNPFRADYSQHGGGQWRDWTGPGSVEKAVGNPNQAVVYVAQGSHANYFSPGKQFLDHLPNVWDAAFGDGDILNNPGNPDPAKNTSATVVPEVVEASGTQFQWLQFNGLWGEYTGAWIGSLGVDVVCCERNGPDNPPNQQPWNNAFAWDGETCDGCQDQSAQGTETEFTWLCPVGFSLYDAQGRHTGKNPDGSIDQQIPNSEYLEYPELHRKSIIIHGSDISSGYLMVANGNGTGPADLIVTAPDHQGGTVDTLNYNNIAVNSQTRVTMNLDSTKNYVATVDEYGDGTDVTQKAPDTTTTNTVDFTPPAQVSDLAGSNSAYGAATLTFTAPGDDGNTGTATSYDLRYSGSAVTDQYWKDAVPVETPAPLVAGSAQSVTVSGLTPGATYYFALKATDKVGLQSPLSNVVSVYIPADTAAPVVTNLAPSGWLNSNAPIITASYSDADPSSGINASSATMSLNGAAPLACAASNGTVSCPTTSLADGSYSYTVSLADNAGNVGTASGSFAVDTQAPTINSPSPTGYKNNASPTISAGYADGGSGINTSAATVKLDGTALPGCTASATTVSCPSAGLAQGSHAILVSVTDNAGNTGSLTGTFFVDTAAPVISGLNPSGNGAGSSPTISASFSDPSPASGVNLATATAKLDGLPLSGCTVTASGISCPATNLAPGSHTLTVQVGDNAGNTATASGSFNVSRNYYWVWYDSASSGYSDWVLMANPASPNNPDLWFNLLIGSLSESLPSLTGYQPGQVPAGQVLSAIYPGVFGGPVKAVSTTGAKAILSQRTLLSSGSLEEVPATDDSALSGHYYWSWYDDVSAGTTDWVMVTNQNPSPASVYYEIRVAGQVKASGTLAAGDHVAPTFPGLLGGPVEVQSWTDSSKQAPAKVIATQRVTTNSGSAFNELPGIPATSLSSSYLWTWYDNKSAGVSDWVMVLNQNATPIYYEITIPGQPTVSGTLQPGTSATPQFPGVIGGPLRVSAWTDATRQTPANVVSSQRVLFGPSFEEVPGLAQSSLASDYNWTWYDNLSANASDWVMVVNPNTSSIYYEIRIAGQLKTSGTIQPGANVTPLFPGIKNGPAEVEAWTSTTKQTAAKVLASQRVLWNGYFNEVVGQ
ncbi:MAG: Ig-like domain-containing protein [Actinomycetota bacterium]|nr:Ig-like domain-containing protein [Actinomycetota bacterium]MCL6092439.1 Ig-like domain-containing protein [Actinomycetota bacterium]MDA8167139.1 Ig-like domain-containing protein [Actinomycetota bacterium]